MIRKMTRTAKRVMMMVWTIRTAKMGPKAPAMEERSMLIRLIARKS